MKRIWTSVVDPGVKCIVTKFSWVASEARSDEYVFVWSSESNTISEHTSESIACRTTSLKRPNTSMDHACRLKCKSSLCNVPR